MLLYHNITFSRDLGTKFTFVLVWKDILWKTCLCSVNTTFREEEFYNYEDYGSNPGEFWNQNADYQNDAPLPQDHFSVKNKGVNRENIVYNPGNPMFYNCDERIPTSLAPLEMGVIWTRAGPVGKSKF